MGFSTDGTGETNNPVGITVGVFAGADDKDCVQADKVKAPSAKTTTANNPYFL